jgi:hypothetical protein
MNQLPAACVYKASAADGKNPAAILWQLPEAPAPGQGILTIKEEERWKEI